MAAELEAEAKEETSIAARAVRRELALMYARLAEHADLEPSKKSLTAAVQSLRKAP